MFCMTYQVEICFALCSPSSSQWNWKVCKGFIQFGKIRLHEKKLIRLNYIPSLNSGFNPLIWMRFFFTFSKKILRDCLNHSTTANTEWKIDLYKDSYFGLLAYDTVYSGKWAPTFRKKPTVFIFCLEYGRSIFLRNVSTHVPGYALSRP
jgi:hypothetical protein